MRNPVSLSGLFLLLLLIPLPLCLSSCGDLEVAPPEETLNTATEEYVRLALAVGRYDENYIDAYLGPEEWQDEVDTEGRELDEIAAKAGTSIVFTITRPRPMMRCSTCDADSSSVSSSRCARSSTSCRALACRSTRNLRHWTAGSPHISLTATSRTR